MIPNPIRLEDLAYSAAFFPPVLETCGGCDGTGKIEGGSHPDPGMGTEWLECPNCQSGTIVREMDAREEHWYLMYLIRKLFNDG